MRVCSSPSFFCDLVCVCNYLTWLVVCYIICLSVFETAHLTLECFNMYPYLTPPLYLHFLITSHPSYYYKILCKLVFWNAMHNLAFLSHIFSSGKSYMILPPGRMHDITHPHIVIDVHTFNNTVPSRLWLWPNYLLCVKVCLLRWSM